MSIVDIFEVNRKECARLLLEYPKWTQAGTFKPKPGAPAEQDPIPGRDWQLESTIIEVCSIYLFPRGLTAELVVLTDYTGSFLAPTRSIQKDHLPHQSDYRAL